MKPTLRNHVKRVSALLVLSVAFCASAQSPKSRPATDAQLRQWLDDLDSVVDRSQDFHIEDWDRALTALRLCQLTNNLKGCVEGSLLEKIYDASDSKPLSRRMHMGGKP